MDDEGIYYFEKWIVSYLKIRSSPKRLTPGPKVKSTGFKKAGNSGSSMKAEPLRKLEKWSPEGLCCGTVLGSSAGPAALDFNRLIFFPLMLPPVGMEQDPLDSETIDLKDITIPSGNVALENPMFLEVPNTGIG